MRNLQGNWFGPTPFTIVQQNSSGEPGYAAQIPVDFGGSATPPASTPTFVVNVLNPNPSGDASGIGNINPARLAYSPWLSTGANSVPAGTPGFQGDFSALNVDAVSAQFGGTAIQRGIDMVSGSTVNVAAGTYAENVNVNKALKLRGSAGGDFSRPFRLPRPPLRRLVYGSLRSGRVRIVQLRRRDGAAARRPRR